MSTGGSLSGHYAFGPAFSWVSIGLAVFTALCQGLISALALTTEASSQWTFRFRLALAEPKWWTFVSLLLLTSLVMSTLAFAAGEGGDPVSVLALSSATFLATVRYMLPAWQHRMYVRTRWLAWTGDSRTGIAAGCRAYCGDREHWTRLIQRCRKRLNRLQPTSSDWYGWCAWTGAGHGHDPTDVFRVVTPDDVDLEASIKGVGIFATADENPKTVSLLWGAKRQGFRRRASRAISSVPLSLLQSSPRTVEGYDGRGIVLALGIIGRNKGLQPWKLVYESDAARWNQLENSSTWTPRPAKVLRSFYREFTMSQYHGLGDQFVSAATELALLLVDVPGWALEYWLHLGNEHQSLEANGLLDAATRARAAYEAERSATLDAHYQSSYISMVLSLNAMNVDSMDPQSAKRALLSRPDIVCTGLLMKARGYAEPAWWNSPEMISHRQAELDGMSRAADWKTSAAMLCGLTAWPEGFDQQPSLWDACEVLEEKVKTAQR